MTWLSRVQQASHVKVNLRNPFSGGSRISPRRGPNSLGEGGQHTILLKFPKNCMKLKEFGPRGGARPKFYYVDPPLPLHTGDKACKQWNPTWLWNPEVKSPEVQNRGISGPSKRIDVQKKGISGLTKRTYALQKLFLKKIEKNFFLKYHLETDRMLQAKFKIFSLRLF